MYNFYGYYCNIIISAIVYQFQLPFTLSRYQLPLDIISSYLLCSNTQHKVTVTLLGRQFTVYFYQILEALRQAITDAAFVLALQHNSTLSTDKTSRKSILFLQLTPPQNWIPLSVYHNRSGSYQDYCAAVATQLYYSDYVLYFLLTLNIGYKRLI